MNFAAQWIYLCLYFLWHDLWCCQCRVCTFCLLPFTPGAQISSNIPMMCGLVGWFDAVNCPYRVLMSDKMSWCWRECGENKIGINIGLISGCWHELSGTKGLFPYWISLQHSEYVATFILLSSLTRWVMLIECHSTQKGICFLAV